MAPTAAKPADQTGNTANSRNAHAEYGIVDCDNLTEISRKVLRVQPGQEDPANLQSVITQIAQANEYDNSDLIPANAPLTVPNDLRLQ